MYCKCVPLNFAETTYELIITTQNHDKFQAEITIN